MTQTRKGKSDVVTYLQDDFHHSCPPRNGRPYKIVIHDLDEHENLFRSGWLTSVEHVGPRGGMVDNRVTS